MVCNYENIVTKKSKTKQYKIKYKCWLKSIKSNQVAIKQYILLYWNYGMQQRIMLIPM